MVESELLSDIVGGRIAIGDLLPNEIELGRTFGVSRTVIREAAKRLEEKGVISIAQGRGSAVLPPVAWNQLDADIIAARIEYGDAGTMHQNLMMVRLALEVEMAAEAAAHLTPELEAKMRRAVSGSAAHLLNPERHLEYDQDFHRAVTEAAQNPVARGIMVSLEGPLQASRRLTNKIPGAIERAQRYHEQILEAIVARQPDEARHLMREHLTESRLQLLASGLLRSPGPAGPNRIRRGRDPR